MKRSIVYLIVCCIAGVVVCYCFYKGGYYFAYDGKIKMEATNVFVGAMACIFAGLTSLLTIENIRLIYIQKFEEQLNKLIARQLELRSKLSIVPILTFDANSNAKLEDEHYFEELYSELKYLVKGIETNQKYDFAEDQRRFEDRADELRQSPEWFYDNEWCLKQIQQDTEVLYISKLMTEYKNPEQESNPTYITAFNRIFNRYRTQHVSYYRHLSYLVKFVNYKTKCGFLRGGKEEYARLIRANMSEIEITMLYYFAKTYDKEGSIEKLGLLKNVLNLLKE